MKTLQGFRTLIFNIVAVIASWIATNYNIDLSEEYQTAISTTIIAAGNVLLRMITKTPIGKKDNK